MNKLYLVGFGPGSYDGMTIRARDTIEKADIVVGFTTYVNLIKSYFPNKDYLATGMGGESERVELAINKAREGAIVALICSGDASLYGMAGLAYELTKDNLDIDIEVVAGVSAAFSGSALLGAAIGNDTCIISLSDYHTSRQVINKRLLYAAKGDFSIALYNVRSKSRPNDLANAAAILLEELPADRLCGIARNIGRNGEMVDIISLSELKSYDADMFCTVFICNSNTELINGKLVCRRGYKLE